jgi:hypothetical protein
LQALSIPIPPLTTFIYEVDQPLVVRAQSTPQIATEGKAERILVLADRVWFKVKRGRQRGAATRLSNDEAYALAIEHHWWLGAVGMRRDDSPQTDFYAQLRSFADDSTSLLPDEWDKRRLLAEAGTLAARATQVAVRRAAGEALSSGEIILLGLGDRDVRLRIRVLADGEAYLAISFRNTMEEKFMVAVLGSLFSVAADDWQVEPTSPLELPLEPGEVVWSTLLSTDAQHALLTALL